VSLNQYPEWVKYNELNVVQSQEIIALKARIKRLEEEVSDLEGINAAMTMDAAMYEDRGPRIKHLEDIINRAHLAFFSDSSDRKVSIAMHRILDEEVRKEVK
jgi:hypothetical protein